jgi:hypothetical protein
VGVDEIADRGRRRGGRVKERTMPDIHIIEPISWEDGGPVAKGPGGRAQQVSLHQGELDRACGVYSLLMALLVWGVVDRDDLVGHAYDGRERLGKFMEQVRTLFSGLIVEGTQMNELRDLVAKTFHTQLDWEYWPYGGTSVRRFAHAHLAQDRPVILGLRSGSTAHAVLAIGYEAGGPDAASAPPRRFLLLDPSRSDRHASPWNASVRTIADPGRLPYRFAGGPDGSETSVSFDTALALWPRE